MSENISDENDCVRNWKSITSQVKNRIKDSGDRLRASERLSKGQHGQMLWARKRKIQGDIRRTGRG